MSYQGMGSFKDKNTISIKKPDGTDTGNNRQKYHYRYRLKTIEPAIY